LGSRRFVVCPDRRSVKKSHAQFNTALLDSFEKPFPHTQLAPADEGLRRSPPGNQIGRHATPFRTILMPPDNRFDRLAQGNRFRLASRPALVDQRTQNRPLIVIQDNKSTFLIHYIQISLRSSHNRA